MAWLRIALAQLDLTVGDIDGNVALAQDAVRRAEAAGAHVLALPEMTLTGYPVEDLVYRRTFAAASRAAIDPLARNTGELIVVAGYLDHDGGPRNGAAVLHRGAVRARYYKHFLPNYGVFDEQRYFKPGTTVPIVRVHGVDVAITICEDLWQDGGPVAAAGRSGAVLVLVINGSPFEQAKSDYRRDLVARRAAEGGATVAYVNMFGGQDELVFDGDSMVIDPAGRLLARGPRFEEALIVHDLELSPATRHDRDEAHRGITVERILLSTDELDFPAQPVSGGVVEPLAPAAEVWDAVVLATRDYVAKNGFESVVLGLSGGIDSAVVATIARDALGADAVHVVAMPSAYSSGHSVTDAEDLARRQCLHYSLVPIGEVVDAFHLALKESGGIDGLAAENLQARVRGTLLMTLSNEHGHLVLTTGNKSELATGFSTLYGDSAGGFAPIKDVPKTLVFELARWRNERARMRGETEPIPLNTITKPPSAELAPDQVDEDRLPPYDVLDAILDDYVERDLGREDLVAAGHDAATVEKVIKLVDTAEFKRRQYPPGPKISPKNFGRDRRLPITNRFRDAAR
ncbi:MAG TPA: NAD+ synthase [Mycobacteriales bacterium]|nr:NAD+ synthase [Mycobacteriales bacterium]